MFFEIRHSDLSPVLTCPFLSFCCIFLWACCLFLPTSPPASRRMALATVSPNNIDKKLQWGSEIQTSLYESELHATRLYSTIGSIGLFLELKSDIVVTQFP